jgi:CRP-like cAMP-binding protein
MITIMLKPAFFTAIEAVCPPNATTVTSLAVREVLFRQDDPSLGLCVVLEGQIDLIRSTAAGRSVKIHTASAGATFAEAALFVPTCHCDAVAAVPTWIGAIRKSSVLAALARHPELSTALMHHLAGSLMQARRLLELRATAPLTEAVLARLTELADADGWLGQNVRLRSLAADAGVTAPALYRALAKLEARGLIERPTRGRVRLL